jgi:nitrous oxide reductase accessory protein NosL
VRKGIFSLILLAQLVFITGALPGEELVIEHPFKNPIKYTDKEKCDNCGMDRNKWARTRHEFRTSKGPFHTCSIFCVAVMSMKFKEAPVKVSVADYLHPERMIDADKAFYVIGSTAPGTMTIVSKIAFPSKEDAQRFVSRYGGTISGFKGALAAARKEIH